MMKVEKIVTGYLEENCYVIYDESNKAILVDPGSEEEKIDKFITNKNLKVVSILVTHYHFDHVGALEYFKEKYKPKIYDYEYADEVIKCSGYTIEVVSTKGHTDEDVSFYFRDEDVMFTGDFLFKGTIGRYDFDNSDMIAMQNSIKLIKSFDPKTKIYPGHGDITTLNAELKNNDFLK